MIGAAPSPEVRGRFESAFAALERLQGSLLSLHTEILDRRLILPKNIEDPAVCPSPCTSCTTEHNSWYQEDEEFSFKCILNEGDAKPEGAGFTCADPQKRNSRA